MILGASVYEWNNYNVFISMLQKIIEDNKKIVEDHEKLIKQKLSFWSKNQLKLKIWEYLNARSKACILKTKKIQEQINIDEYIQLKILKKGLLF